MKFVEIQEIFLLSILKHKITLLKGFRVSFKQFITWITEGNSEADEHWTPAYLLCGVCDIGYKFIGHAEHFSEDIQVNSLITVNIDLIYIEIPIRF